MLIKARAYSKKNYVTIQSTLRKETSCSTKHHLKWSLQRTWICTYNGMHSWQGNRYSPTPRTQSTFHNSTTGFPAKLHLRNQCQNSILMAHHCPDLGVAFFNQSEALRKSRQSCVLGMEFLHCLVLPTLFLWKRVVALKYAGCFLRQFFYYL